MTKLGSFFCGEQKLKGAPNQPPRISARSASLAYAVILLLELLLRVLGQEAGYICAAHWAGALDHLGAFCGHFDFAVLDLSLLATLYAITFEIHGIASSGRYDVGAFSFRPYRRIIHVIRRLS